MRPNLPNVAMAIAVSSQLFWSSVATAEEVAVTGSRWGLGYWNAAVPAPRDAVEVTLGSGYVQGVGRLESGPVDDLSTRTGGGIGLEPGIGYRISPRWMVGASGAYELYSTDSGRSDPFVSGAVGRVEVTTHLAPYSRIDPWLRMGSGYRLFYDSDPSERDDGTSWHGFELARLMGGIDIRIEERIAIAPTFGMDLSIFLWRREPIPEPRISTFAYLGLQGRFDVGGRYSGRFGVAER